MLSRWLELLGPLESSVIKLGSSEDLNCFYKYDVIEKPWCHIFGKLEGELQKCKRRAQNLSLCKGGDIRHSRPWWKFLHLIRTSAHACCSWEVRLWELSCAVQLSPVWNCNFYPHSEGLKESDCENRTKRPRKAWVTFRSTVKPLKMECNI